MCGIVGYIGSRNATEVIMNGLRRLEYRGYDSAGIAVVKGKAIHSVKSPGKLANLDARLAQANLDAPLGIGHTRWATHGVPNEANAHPHFDEHMSIAVVHNGIIENYRSLREKLYAAGVQFRSDTDSETLAHLIEQSYEGNLFDAVKRALRDVQGAYALGVIAADQPELMVAARKGSPLIVGIGNGTATDGEGFIASDVPAIMQYTRKVAYLDNDQVCEVRRGGFRVETIGGRPVELKLETVNWDAAAAEKGGFEHYMLKEINEQPDVIRHALQGRIDAQSGAVTLGDAGMADAALDEETLRGCTKIVILACGTAWHAGLVGRRLIETFARVPVEIDIASEYRYRDPIVGPGTIVMPVSQSGETADTMEAVRIAQSRGAKVYSIINVMGSSIARMSDRVMYTNAGPEIGVASTKAYTSQIAAFALFAIYLGRLRGTMEESIAAAMIAHLRELPPKLQVCLDRDKAIVACAADAKYRDPRSAFFMGRGYNFPSALEGALKLKEISYIHAEGYAAGEMKHGPIALITDEVPMIGIATRSDTYEKVISNIQEIRARRGIILSIATDGDGEVKKHSDDVLYVPDCFEPLSPIVNAIPLQLLAYHIAVNRGCDVDQPRNLAKSVTVE